MMRKEEWLERKREREREGEVAALIGSSLSDGLKYLVFKFLFLFVSKELVRKDERNYKKKKIY